MSLSSVVNASTLKLVLLIFLCISFYHFTLLSTTIQNEYISKEEHQLQLAHAQKDLQTLYQHFKSDVSTKLSNFDKAIQWFREKDEAYSVALEQYKEKLKEMLRRVEKLEKKGLRIEERIMNESKKDSRTDDAAAQKLPVDRKSSSAAFLVEEWIEELHTAELIIDQKFKEMEQRVKTVEGGERISHQPANDHSDTKVAEDEEEGKTKRKRRKISPPLFESVRRCNIPCNYRGLSIRIPHLTQGCECICVGGWTGTVCEIPPPGYIAVHDGRSKRVAALDVFQPKVVIPRQMEELPALSENKKGCREAAKQYYLDHYKTEEYRTDAALKFFWELAKNSIFPSCSDDTSQTVIIDIGANVGEQFPYWEREFLNKTMCKKNDTLLVLVEPNPENFVLLRHQISQWEKIGEESNSQRSGRVIIVDSAVSYFNGEAPFIVNSKQSLPRNKGNERGSLDTQNLQSDAETARFFRTKTQTLSEILRSVPRALLRSNYTISLMKIDAEGFDPAVLYGAANLISRTNIIVFECHKLWKRNNFTLYDTVSYLAKYSMATYKIGMFQWIPLTPPAYWDDVYDSTLEWSNCIAIKKGHPFSHMFSLPEPCQPV